MHFYYFDETGCTGEKNDDKNQPIFVLGGISIRDEGWRSTHGEFSKIISNYFNRNIPNNFELHSLHLLAPNGKGHFKSDELEKRMNLVKDILNILLDRKHDVNFFAIDKNKLMKYSNSQVNLNLDYNYESAYLLAYDYLITEIEYLLKKKQGKSARGMFFIDENKQFLKEIRRIANVRCFEVQAKHQVKKIVEFSHPVDSKKSSMIQFADLIVYCVRKHLEIKLKYTKHQNSQNLQTKQFYKECFEIINSRRTRKTIVERVENPDLNNYLRSIQAK